MTNVCILQCILGLLAEITHKQLLKVHRILLPISMFPEDDVTIFLPQAYKNWSSFVSITLIDLQHMPNNCWLTVLYWAANPLASTPWSASITMSISLLSVLNGMLNPRRPVRFGEVNPVDWLPHDFSSSLSAVLTGPS